MSKIDDFINSKLIECWNIDGDEDVFFQANGSQKFQELDLSILIQINLIKFFQNFSLILCVWVAFGDVHLELIHANLIITRRINICEKGIADVHLSNKLLRKNKTHIYDLIIIK